MVNLINLELTQFNSGPPNNLCSRACIRHHPEFPFHFPEGHRRLFEPRLVPLLKMGFRCLLIEIRQQLEPPWLQGFGHIPFLESYEIGGWDLFSPSVVLSHNEGLGLGVFHDDG